MDEGHVSIRTERGSTELFEGQRWSSKPPVAALKVPQPVPQQEQEPEEVRSQPRLKPVPQPRKTLDWRSPARAGNYLEAARRLRGIRPSGYEDVVLAVETMRMVDRPAEADRYLREFVLRSPGDPRAHYAQFARARLKMNELDQPLEAAVLLGKLRASPVRCFPPAARRGRARGRGIRRARASRIRRAIWPDATSSATPRARASSPSNGGANYPN